MVGFAGEKTIRPNILSRVVKTTFSSSLEEISIRSSRGKDSDRKYGIVKEMEAGIEDVPRIQALRRQPNLDSGRRGGLTPREISDAEISLVEHKIDLIR